MALSVLVTGVTGYIGAQLVPRLRADGHAVRGFARNASAVTLDIPVVEGDVRTGAGLDAALRDVDVACFLIHAMDGGTHFQREEREGAHRFVAAARAAEVRRVVYLGGITPGGDESEHLESRAAVEEILRDGFPEAVALRASLVIGAGSRSFDLLANLVERLPVLALPTWRDRRTAPIDHRDVVEYLARAVTSPDVEGAHAYDVAGATELSYGELVERIAAALVDGRPTIPLPFDATPLASRLTAAITGEDADLVAPLMASLEHDLIPDDRAARERFGVDPRGVDTAIADAVADRLRLAAAA